MGPIRWIGMLLIAFGFLGFMFAGVKASLGSFINPGQYIVVGAIGVVIVIISLIYERYQDRRKEGNDDLSQY